MKKIDKVKQDNSWKSLTGLWAEKPLREEEAVFFKKQKKRDSNLQMHSVKNIHFWRHVFIVCKLKTELFVHNINQYRFRLHIVVLH